MRGHEMPESAGSGGSAPSSASSSALTAGCSAGLFLPYQAHQAISSSAGRVVQVSARRQSNAVMSQAMSGGVRSEEHTSELQSQSNLVCRLLLEKKNKIETCAPVVVSRSPNPATMSLDNGAADRAPDA